MSQSITIDPRFCGPEHSANGGYACGCVAEAVEGAGHRCARINLRAPPPLGRPLSLSTDGDTVTLIDPDSGEAVADAQPGTCTIEPPAPPSFADAQRMSKHYSGFDQHALPHCFVCGPDRTETTGLCIYPGRADTDPQGLVAAPWRPHTSFGEADGRVHQRLMWAALDCPGYFAVAEPGELALLASMTGRVDERARVDEPCVVIGWSLGREGRKLRAATAVFGDDGRLLGLSEQLWIQLRPAP